MSSVHQEIRDDIKCGRLQGAVQKAVNACHDSAHASGWWTNLSTGEQMNTIQRGIADLYLLMISEVVEAYEGHRKDNKPDEHLPQYRSKDVEIADAFIRVCDYMGQRMKEGAPMQQIVCDKLQYNMRRQDHKLDNRKKDGGKKT